MTTPSTLALLCFLIATAAATMATGSRRPALASRVARGGLWVSLGGLAVAAATGGMPGGDGLFSADRLGTAVALFVAAMAVVIATYADRNLGGDPRAPRFLAGANLLVAATVAMALANRTWVLAIAWIGVSAATVFIIGADGRSGSRHAARTAARNLGIGDLALIAALVAVTVRLDAWGEPIPVVAERLGNGGPGLLLLAGAGLLIAAFARSAQLPFQRWLPASVGAPTPVSALLHAGVVNGSAVLLVRWHPALSTSGVLTLVAVAVGTTGVLVGMAVARTRPDVKGGLGWTTVAQMGFMIAQCSLGLVGPAVVHLMAHGMFKSSLFLGAGSAFDGGGHHAAPRRPTGRDAAAAATGAAAIVAIGFAVVRPHFLDHPAAIVPVAFAWGLVAHAIVTWRTTRPAAAAAGGGSALAALALLGAFTAATAASAGLDAWITAGSDGSLPSQAAPVGAGWLAGGMVIVVALASMAGPLSSRYAPHLRAQAWLRVASWSHPTAPSPATPKRPAGMSTLTSPFTLPSLQEQP